MDLILIVPQDSNVMEENVNFPVHQLSVDPMLLVMLVFVLVYQDSMETLQIWSEAVRNLTAVITLTANTMKFASKIELARGPVSMPVKEMNVVQMPSVSLRITELLVYVKMDILEIQATQDLAADLETEKIGAQRTWIVMEDEFVKLISQEQDVAMIRV